MTYVNINNLVNYKTECAVHVSACDAGSNGERVLTKPTRW